MKILCILSNPKPLDESYSKKMAFKFIEEYKKIHPEHTIKIIDLYVDHIDHLQYSSLEKAREHKGDMLQMGEEFSSYDKYIIAAPMWNLGTPSILKSYFDHIINRGISFNYNRFGIPVGLLKNKKAIYLGTRGGAYPFPISLLTFDFKYIKSIFKFMGIKDISSIIFENIDKHPNKREENFKKIINKINRKVMEF